MKSSRDQESREPYRSPRFLVYGDILELTQSGGMTTFIMDGGKGHQQDKVSQL